MLSTIGAVFGHYGPGWGGGFFFGPLIGILFWVVLLATLVFFFRRGPGRHHWGPHSAEAVLGERYARGEVSEEEYRERLAVLRERPR